MKPSPSDASASSVAKPPSARYAEGSPPPRRRETDARETKAQGERRQHRERRAQRFAEKNFGAIHRLREQIHERATFAFARDYACADSESNERHKKQQRINKTCRSAPKAAQTRVSRRRHARLRERKS
ncbi:MAG: hypothetical protein BroJett039_02410 [Chloroflexota bacterium]|nr:MAG: hypothetical protein BroJett039_02410 [Chloroflexota bacterium]